MVCVRGTCAAPTYPGEQPDAPASEPQTIALVDAYNDRNAEADLKVYDNQFGLPECTVGTGFSDQELARLGAMLQARPRKTSPFVGMRPPREARFVRPGLVAEIEFREWMNAGSLRHPSYKGLREDKDAREVVRERPA